jgi:arylsulfatase A-like enzyme
MTPDLWRNLKAQYFGCVSWIDDNIGRILRHVDDNTVVVFTSDHGDILGDHGYFSKGLFAHEGNIRVPLLMRFPGKEPATYTHIVQSIDIAPTVMEFLGIKRKPKMQGRSLLKHLDGNKPMNHWAFSCIGAKDRLRMVRTPRFKYWLYNQEYLYDLERDPGERENIASVHKDALAMMRLQLIKAMIKAEDL